MASYNQFMVILVYSNKLLKRLHIKRFKIVAQLPSYALINQIKQFNH